MISDECGNTVKELHECFKEEFLEAEQAIVFDKKYKLYPSTTLLSTKEFSDYIKKIEVMTEILDPDTNHLESK